MFGFPTDANAERQSVPVNCTEINSGSVGTSAFMLSVIYAIIQTSEIEGTNLPLFSLVNSKSVISVRGAQVKFAWDTTCIRNSSYSVVLFLSLVFIRDSTSAAWSFTLAQ